jgi:hypothetical protein
MVVWADHRLKCSVSLSLLLLCKFSLCVFVAVFNPTQQMFCICFCVCACMHRVCVYASNKTIPLPLYLYVCVAAS